MATEACVYCDCCSTNDQHIAEHYDPMGLTRYNEDAETLLREFREQWGDECDLYLVDVKSYIDSRPRPAESEPANAP